MRHSYCDTKRTEIQVIVFMVSVIYAAGENGKEEEQRRIPLCVGPVYTFLQVGIPIPYHSKIHCLKAFQITVMQHEPIVCSQTCYVTDKHPVLGGRKSGNY